MLRVLTVPALAAALLLFACPRVSAGPATDRLRDFFAAVNAVLTDPTVQERPLEAMPRIQRLVADLSDAGAAAAAALGREWQARTPTERAEFIQLFAELLERAYVGRLGGIAHVIGGVKVSYLEETLAGDEATVATELRAKDGRDVAVEYRMTNHHAGWLVRDIVLDGVSTVENYHAQFRRLLRQGTYATLVSLVRTKLNEESLIFARAAPHGPAPRSTAVATSEIPIVAPPPEQVEPTWAPGPAAAAAGVEAARVPPVSRAPRPVAPPAGGATTPTPPEVALPVAVLPALPPSSADADSSGLFLLVLSLSLVGVAGTAYLRRRALK